MHCLLTIFSSLALVGFSNAVCPGANFAFYNLGTPPGKAHAWAISDDGCNIQNGGVCLNNNPCSCPGVGCTSAPIHVGKVNVNGLWYNCAPQSNAGNCNLSDGNVGTVLGAVPESCCRNDGKRNLAEGLINERQLVAIEQTGALLDIQKREYDDALKRGVSAQDISALRAFHKRDLEIAEMKEFEAGF